VGDVATLVTGTGSAGLTEISRLEAGWFRRENRFGGAASLLKQA
jgi:hypothetical protein